jgi:hypothetical protein
MRTGRDSTGGRNERHRRRWRLPVRLADTLAGDPRVGVPEGRAHQLAAVLVAEAGARVVSRVHEESPACAGLSVWFVNVRLPPLSRARRSSGS